MGLCDNGSGVNGLRATTITTVAATASLSIGLSTNFAVVLGGLGSQETLILLLGPVGEFVELHSLGVRLEIFKLSKGSGEVALSSLVFLAVGVVLVVLGSVFGELKVSLSGTASSSLDRHGQDSGAKQSGNHL